MDKGRTQGICRWLGTVATSLVLVTAVGACGSDSGSSSSTSGSGSASAKADKPKIGLVMKGLNNEFFKQMQAGADKYAATKRDSFDFKAVGMKDERDFAAQVDAVDNFITEKYDIIVVAPADSKAMVAPLKRAVDAGITVINIDVPLDADAQKQAGLSLPFYGPDNTLGAKMAGDALAKKIGPGAKVVIIEGNPEADNAKQRKAGFEQAAKAGGLDVVASKTAHWETEEANTLMTNLLSSHPDIKGVMAANDSMALGVAKALDSAGQSKKIQLIGFDNIPAVKPLLDQGKMLATVEQYGAKMAVFGIEYGLKTKAGKGAKGWVKTPIKLIPSSGA